jgi:hypothetical protein
MPKFRTIQWKAFIMLLVFTASFCVVCHCGARASAGVSKTHSCCEKHSRKQSDPKDCGGMQAMKFNLEEKQTAAAYELAPVAVFLITHLYSLPAALLLPEKRSRTIADHWAYKHAPPDLQVLYQRFLI